MLYYLVEIIRDGEVIDKFLFADMRVICESMKITCCNTSNKLTMVQAAEGSLIQNLVHNGIVVGKITPMKVEETPTHL